jgi:hypothetical protein
MIYFFFPLLCCAAEPESVCRRLYKSLSNGEKREKHAIRYCPRIMYCTLYEPQVRRRRLLLFSTASSCYYTQSLSHSSLLAACSWATVGGVGGTRSDFSERPADETGPDEMFLPAHRSLSDREGRGGGRDRLARSLGFWCTEYCFTAPVTHTTDHILLLLLLGCC